MSQSECGRDYLISYSGSLLESEAHNYFPITIFGFGGSQRHQQISSSAAASGQLSKRFLSVVLLVPDKVGVTTPSDGKRTHIQHRFVMICALPSCGSELAHALHENGNSQTFSSQAFNGLVALAGSQR